MNDRWNERFLWWAIDALARAHSFVACFSMCVSEATGKFQPSGSRTISID
jgi:hypothetical protein